MFGMGTGVASPLGPPGKGPGTQARVAGGGRRRGNRAAGPVGPGQASRASHGGD